jgi:hypothetical protein
MLPIVLRAAITVLLTLVATFAASPTARASNAKAEVVLEMERIETVIRTTRWNLNTLEEKKRLQNDLRLLRILYDRIVDYEAELMAFPCAGAVIDGEGGPPESTEETDIAGLLSQEQITAAQLNNQSGTPPAGGGDLGGGRGLRFGGGIGFVRTITDVEVRLIAGLVQIDDRLANDDWHLNNLELKEKLIAEKENIRAALRRIRNSRC